MELAIKIVWIIVALLGVYVLYISLKKFTKIMNNKILMERDLEMYKINFSEQAILSHLDFIITECLDYYIAMILTPKHLYYINTSVETEMLNKLSETIPERISPTLYSQLSLIYDPEQISSVIGEKIYTKVLEYVIEFNVENENREKNKKPNA